METPVYLKLEKYQAFINRVQELSKQNEQALKLKTPMKLAALKADYNKFYNNPDKQKQEGYQAWIKEIANDFQLNESSKILAALNKKSTTYIVKK